MILKYIQCLVAEVHHQRNLQWIHFVQRFFVVVNSFPPNTTGNRFWQRWQVGRSIAGNYQCKTDHWMDECCFCQPNGVRSTQLAVWVPDTRGQQGAVRDGEVNLSHFQACVGDSRQIFLDRTIDAPWEEFNSHFLGQKKNTLSKWEVVNFWSKCFILKTPRATGCPKIFRRVFDSEKAPEATSAVDLKFHDMLSMTHIC